MACLIRVDIMLLFSRISPKTHLYYFRFQDVQLNANAHQFVFGKFEITFKLIWAHYQTCRESNLRESGDSASSHLLKVKHFIICLLKELNSVKEFKCHITQAK